LVTPRAPLGGPVPCQAGRGGEYWVYWVPDHGSDPTAQVGVPGTPNWCVRTHQPPTSMGGAPDTPRWCAWTPNPPTFTFTQRAAPRLPRLPPGRPGPRLWPPCGCDLGRHSFGPVLSIHVTTPRAGLEAPSAVALSAGGELKSGGKGKDHTPSPPPHAAPPRRRPSTSLLLAAEAALACPRPRENPCLEARLVRSQGGAPPCG
jgi:hypothetical protein